MDKQKVSLWTAAARINDEKAMNKLFEPIPNAAEVRENFKTGKPFTGQIWDKVAQRDYWISSDGEIVSCFTFVGLTGKQVAQVRMLFEELRGSQPDEQLIVFVLSQVTGLPAHVIERQS